MYLESLVRAENLTALASSGNKKVTTVVTEKDGNTETNGNFTAPSMQKSQPESRLNTLSSLGRTMSDRLTRYWTSDPWPHWSLGRTYPAESEAKSNKNKLIRIEANITKTILQR